MAEQNNIKTKDNPTPEIVKPKKVFEIQCPRCRTNIEIPVERFMISNKEKTVNYIEQKRFRCAKCECDCVSRVKEVK